MSEIAETILDGLVNDIWNDTMVEVNERSLGCFEPDSKVTTDMSLVELTEKIRMDSLKSVFKYIYPLIQAENKNESK